jgi:hypothetical protein
MVLVLIGVIVPRIGTIFLLECLTLALSQETWTIHIFPSWFTSHSLKW